ncbi:MAG: hypothetical protein M3Y21_11590 [Candidatus Eremiobacteraeota bacterium]|nr:hypothetical protein [Candidatus Eremiobacteraeota bacterium]
MPVNSEPFAKLVERIGEFYITDRAMKKAQIKIKSALAAGSIDEQSRGEYIDAAQRYFSGFEREARQHLNTVDKRLEHADQVQFNLNAERGVAVGRIQATQDVLAAIAQATPR